MFNKATSGFRQAKRAVLEKSGKVQATQEGSIFQGKIASLQATHRAFQNLQKVGASIFKNQKKTEGDDGAASKNPADEFLTQIQMNIKLKKQYERARLAMDTAKATAHACAEAAKVPGKNQDAKNAKAENAKEDETTKIAEYESAKDALLQGITELEDVRDEKFQQCIQAMCSILEGLKPDWDLDSKSDAPAPSGGDSSAFPSPQAVEEKDNDVKEDVADEQDNGQGADAPADARVATDSESD